MNAFARCMTSALSSVLDTLNNGHVHGIHGRHTHATVSSKSTVATVPTEVLLLVFVHCAPQQLSALARVCTAWRGPAQALLFCDVRLNSVSALTRFARALRVNPILAPLVRALDMPGVAQALGVPAPSPNGDARTAVWLAHTKWAQRKALEDDVAFVLSSCTRATSVVVPAPGLALDTLDTEHLERLELRAPRKSSTPLALPALPQLRELTLYNFHLDSSPIGVQPMYLPHMQRVRLVHCDVTRDWLHTLFAGTPALSSVVLEESAIWGPRDNLFSPVAERLEELALQGCEWGTSDVALETLSALRTLTVQWDPTSSYPLPPRLESLHLHVSPPCDDDDADLKTDNMHIDDDLYRSLVSSITRWQPLAALKHIHVSLSPQSRDIAPLLRAWCAQQGLAASIYDA